MKFFYFVITLLWSPQGFEPSQPHPVTNNDSVGIIEKPGYSSVITSYISDTEIDESQDSSVLIPAWVDEAEK